MEKVRFYTDKVPFLCFRHAVLEAQRGEDVRTEVDHFASELHLGTVHCVRCEEERKREAEWQAYAKGGRRKD